MSKVRSCGTVGKFFELVDTYPNYRDNLLEIEEQLANYQESPHARQEVLTIPVVVHIVLKDPSKVTDSQVNSQIKILNEDFRAKNTDLNRVPQAFRHLIADCAIEFELAKKAPDGTPTGGITRHKTHRDDFPKENDPVKSATHGGADAWDTINYLNLWVCDLSRGLLGYAQFPGGPRDTDGVVVDYKYFGNEGTATQPFHLGRTATHEVGHYLNLKHIWGESIYHNCRDDDDVSDTPRQRGPNRGTPSFPNLSCNNGPNGDLFVNYMDYVNDTHMMMFTQGQALRMRAVLSTVRKDLVK